MTSVAHVRGARASSLSTLAQTWSRTRSATATFLPATTTTTAAACVARRESGYNAYNSSSGNSHHHASGDVDVVAFAEQPERLLCDPANVLCVYVTYEYRFVVSDARRRVQAEQLIDRALALAHAQYRDAVATFARLPAAEQRAHVMRDVPAAAAASTTALSSLRSSSNSSEEALYRVLRREWPTYDDDDDSDSDSSSDASASDDTSPSSQQQQQSSSPQRPRAACGAAQVKVRLYVDMIASRKALRDVPTQSKPYALAQHVYRYVYAHYHAVVLHTCIGISDAKVKLTCRDVLFPYKQVVMRSRRDSNNNDNNNDNNDSSRRRRRMSTSARAVSAAAEASVRRDKSHNNNSSSSTTRATTAAARLSSTARVRPAATRTLLSYAYTRLPPINTDLIDQTRMLLCFRTHNA